MEKVYVTLLVLVAACLIDENVANSSRRARMDPIWGRPHSNTNDSRRGSGSFAVKGKAGGLFRQADATTSAPSSQPAKPTAADCTEAGFFPAPGSCTDFYRCVDWTGAGSFFSIFHFKCPLGTVFDDGLDVCNHAAWAGRSECGGTAESPASSEKPVPVVTPTVGPSEPVSVVTVTEGEVTAGPVTIVTGSEGTVTPTVTDVVTKSPVTDSTPPGVFSLTCYADNKYRRHPLYCNKYYYCIYDGDVWNVPSFTCPEGLVFDGDNQICTRPSEADLDCKKAPTDKPKTSSAAPPLESTVSVVTDASSTVSEASSTASEASSTASEASSVVTEETSVATDSPTVVVTDAPVDTTTQKTWAVDPTSLFACPAPGYYPFEGDCIRFYKCVETEELKLKGLLYRCPEGYGYSEERQRCRKQADLPVCQKVPQLQHLSLRYESATPVYPEDFMWFFKN